MQTSRIKGIPYGKHWVDRSDEQALLDVLKSDFITRGPRVAAFENAIAKFVGAKYAVSTNSGSTALLAACFAAGIKEGDEVITTPYTFVASSNCIVWLGARPVFVDVDEQTLNIDPVKIEDAITKETKAILVVDFAGLPCDLDSIMKIAKKNKLLLIEDAAHAVGSKYKGKRIGGISDMTCFSFHPVKTITAGEAGMITTNNFGLYQKLLIFRNGGITKDVGLAASKIGPWYYEMRELGLSLRLSDLHAALGMSQLKKINFFIKKRREIVKIYNKTFSKLPVITPNEPSWAVSAWHLYPVRIDLAKVSLSRKDIFKKLRDAGLGVQVHYIPVHVQPYYQKKFRFKSADFPIAKKVYDCEITLPLFPKMTKAEIRYVIDTFKKIVS